MTRWTRIHDAFSDRWFYDEIGVDRHATRHIELQGPERTATAAAIRTEWNAALHAGTADDYYAVFGATPDMPVHVWEEIELEDITAEDFEAVWVTARAACEARAHARLTPET